MAWHTPADAEELAEILGDRPEDGRPLLPTGAPEPGTDPAGDGVDVVSTARLSGIRELRPRDLTVTVGAGTRVADLLDELAAEGLWAALAGPALDLSVGGLVAAAPWGPLDASHGDLRRQLLACEVVTWAGEPVRWGRAVLKDVAGYGMTRAVAGSWGTLGIVHRATFRLWPAPEADRRVPLVPGDDGPAALGARIAVSDLDAEVRPDAAMWRLPGSGEEVVEVRLIGTADSVDLREDRMRSWAAEHGAEAGGSGPWERGEDGERPPAGAPRDPRSSRFALAPGRKGLADLVGELGHDRADDLVGAEADLLGGRLRVELRRGGDGEEENAPLGRLPGAGGEIPVRVERGTAAEIEAAEDRRPAGLRALERRVREALSGRPRHWMSAYL